MWLAIGKIAAHLGTSGDTPGDRWLREAAGWAWRVKFSLALYIDLLGERIVAARQRLATAEDALRQAEAALDDARTAFFRAKAREDALEKRRELWRDEQRGLQARREEALTDDLLQARHTARH